MHFIKRRYTRILLLLILQFSCFISAFAATDPVATSPLLGSKDSVKVNYSSTVADYQQLLRTANPSVLPQIEAGTTRIQNRVSLGIEEDSRLYFQTDFTATVRLHIKKYNSSFALSEELDKDFTVNYAKAEGSKYNAIQYFTFQDAYKVEVTIVSIDTHGAGWDVAKALRVDNTLQAARDYVFDCSKLISGLAVSKDNVNGELKAVWNDPANGQTEYDVEWAWIDESAVEDYKISGQFADSKIFTNNATRVTTVRNTYNIPLLYDGEGRIFVRVRPAEIKTTGQRVEGQWSWVNSGQPVYYSFTGHENSLNWQASTSYAEEGKRKSVVQYFDGTLRNRQTVTKDNTTGTNDANGTTIVAESFYDYQGRPVIQVMPAPTLNTAIAYSQNFNKAINFTGYPKWAYDSKQPTASNCGAPAAKLDPATGTSQYYSPGNPLINTPATDYNPNKYIPDAEGYPFTETRLTPDGRIAAQGGVGINHRIGSTHETKYFYESPAQEELDALFGTDAGVASHYAKNIVKDANGQYSISYVDMHGRSVATALAGKSPDQMEALPSLNTKNFTKQLIDNETNRIVGRSIISSKPLVALKDAIYHFNYQLNPDQLNLLSCAGTSICYDCLYQLKFSIVSDCGSIIYQDSTGNFTLGQYLNQCTGDGKVAAGQRFSKLFDVTLAEGAYTINKVLTLSTDAQNNYRENVFIKNDTCKRLVDYYSETHALMLTQSNCSITCASCDAAIGHDLAGFRANFVQQTGMQEPLADSVVALVTAAYNNARANCDRICNGVDADGLEAIRGIQKMMLADVSPGGQYASLDNVSGTYSIFNQYTPWPHVFTFYGAAYRNPINYTWNSGTPSDYNFKDAAGQTANPVYLPASSPVITPVTFSNQFQTSWAQQLLPSHPEYCKLKTVMEKLPATYGFEAKLNRITTWNALTASTGVPGAINNIVASDPFFSNISGPAPGAAYYSQMVYKLSHFMSLTSGPTTDCPSAPTTNYGYATLWQMAQSMVFCRNSLTAGCANSPQSLCFRNTPGTPPVNPTTGCSNDWDLVWQNFRSLYLTERRKMISQYLNSQCGVSNSSLAAQGHTPRFIDYNSSGNGSLNNIDLGDLGPFFTQLGSANPNASGSTATGQGLLTAQYDSTCRGYAAAWIFQLSDCELLSARWANQSVKTSDSTWLVDKLRAVCLQGSDADHYLGSSSIKPTDPDLVISGIHYRDFPDVIKRFFIEKGIPLPPFTATCNPYLITVPKPYDHQPLLTPTVIMTKPSVCECTQISAIQFEYTNAQYPGTFSKYLENKYQTFITQGALDTLLSLCNGSYQCVFLPTPISLPPVLQCHPAGTATNGTCINCAGYAEIKNAFFNVYNHASPVSNPQTQDDINWNMAFQNYANWRTGFSKNWVDYVNFEAACSNLQTISCSSLDSLLQLFYQSTVYQQNPSGSSCRQAFVTYFNNAFGVSKSYDQWITMFSNCGHTPDPCSVRLTCTLMKTYINQFYDTYGVQVYKNANCMQLFTTFMNNKMGVNFTYAQIQANYKYLCGVSCDLNVCGFLNSFLLAKAYEQFMIQNDNHPWTLPDCKEAFVAFFNEYFDLEPQWAYDEINDAYLRLIKAKCGTYDINNLCTPAISCKSLQYIVQLYHRKYDGSPVDNCEETFTAFFNEQMNTNYSFAEIAELYVKNCGTKLTVCSVKDIGDCAALLAAVQDFITQNPPSSCTGAPCQEQFAIYFSNLFGKDYSYADLVKLYDSQCGYKLTIGEGGDDTGIPCDKMQNVLKEFTAKYPDPASQMADVKAPDACQRVFAAYFNSVFGTSYSYAEIELAYRNCGVILDVCKDKCAEYITFAADFNTRYADLTLPLAAKQQLFAFEYNKKFITDESAAPEKGDVAAMEATTAAAEVTIKETNANDDYFRIIKGVDSCFTTPVITGPETQSPYNPQALLSMKQVYYIMHPAGLPDQCEDDYASWFNLMMKTTYNAKDLFTQYNNVCGNNAGYICSVPDDAATGEEERSISLNTEINMLPPVIYQEPLLCGLNEPVFHTVPYTENPCKDLDSMAYTTAEVKWQLYVDSLRNIFDLAYYNKCMGAKNYESFTVNYDVSEYHYTLYYYDQAGNLVRTVPPAGIDDRHSDAAFLANVKQKRLNVLNGQPESSNILVPAHVLTTNYRYNALNGVVAQNTPDAGVSKFWYDRLARLVISQNAKQAAENKYSFTQYDELGRISIVGQKPQSTAVNQQLTTNNTALSAWLNNTQDKEQITRTVYDVAYYGGELPSLLEPTLYQKNLRNRISYTQLFDTEPAGTAVTKWAALHNAATYYSYDIHGNVDTLVQDYGHSQYRPNAMNSTGNRFKKMVYRYDLISGKVNEVAYQPGAPDAFYHRYSYDAENRITQVETSTDRVIWEKDARYSYYKHGPLARAVIGQNQVQGIDYAYNLQGLLKGVNSTSVGDGSFDIGGDGKISGTNNAIARDAFGFALHYYQNDAQGIADYKTIGGAGYKPFPNPATLIVGSNTWNLYNGNIAAMAVNIPKLGNAMQYKYKYDQLNRLLQTYTYTGLTTANAWNVSATDDYREQISYDANGNIRTYLRNGTVQGGGQQLMDKLTYQYEKNAAGQIVSNKLRYVHDQITDANYTEDIDNQTALTLAQVQAEKSTALASDNYQYDPIGNLIKDAKEGISAITWNVYGKISSIAKASGTLQYTYDVNGNRISKTYNGKTTWYVRDATGNVMSIYESGGVNSGALTQTEISLYGSSRLGVYNVYKNVQITNPAQINFGRGDKFFELSNHLGNVLATVSDRKLQHTTAGNIVDYYEAEIATANDYAPFGMTLPGRKFAQANTEYRYGFNRQEHDRELNENIYTAQFWEYDGRIGRRWNIDPFYKESISNYSTFKNNPLIYVDPSGNTDYYNAAGSWIGSDGVANGVKQIALTPATAKIIQAETKLNKTISMDRTKYKDILDLPSEDYMKALDRAYTKTTATNNEQGVISGRTMDPNDADGVAIAEIASTKGSSLSGADQQAGINAAQLVSIDMHAHSHGVFIRVEFNKDANGNIVSFKSIGTSSAKAASAPGTAADDPTGGDTKAAVGLETAGMQNPAMVIGFTGYEAQIAKAINSKSLAEFRTNIGETLFKKLTNPANQGVNLRIPQTGPFKAFSKVITFYNSSNAAIISLNYSSFKTAVENIRKHDPATDPKATTTGKTP